VAFHVPAANNKEYSLNSTHEEIVTPLVWEFIQSYKDLPTSVYQIQNKFRNEKRAKSGILRWREFLMKDAYSFHSNNEDFEKYYEAMKWVYLNIFKRIGLWEDTIIALADWWTFTEKFSHEFQVKTEIGEDVIYKDNKTWICYNKEVAPSQIWKENISNNELLEKKDIKHSSDIIWVEALEKFLWVPREETTKTLFFETSDNNFIVAAVRWDYEVNTLKLQKILWVSSLKFASEEKVIDITGAKIWYAWIINLPENLEVYLDDSIKWLINFETWTNKTW
jgi:prolyl-tRNA synthetase